MILIGRFFCCCIAGRTSVIRDVSVQFLAELSNAFCCKRKRQNISIIVQKVANNHRHIQVSADFVAYRHHTPIGE